MKVQHLAEELKISVTQLLGLMNGMGIRVKNASAKLDPGKVTKIKKQYEHQKKDKANQSQKKPSAPISIEVETIKVGELTALLKVNLIDIMKFFLLKGLSVNINTEIDQKTIVEIAESLDIPVKVENKEAESEIGLKSTILEMESAEEKKNPKSAKKRPPVITIMGHVDHGKTLLLDTIRKTNIIAKEAGGITQHIGAYQVTVNDNPLTFLDTPGHEAFTSLRARGAQVTDICILVVAADEGIKPQTEEAIHHAQAADVPIIVAINKVDRPNADVEKCKQELSNLGLLPEDWGGKTIMVPVSAKTGNGIDELLEMVNLSADMLELKANPKGNAKGIVIESHLSRKKGPVATILIKSGILKVGDHFSIDVNYGKVRALMDDKGTQIKTAGPAYPVEILGLNEVPTPGSVLEVYDTEKEAKTIATERKLKEEQSSSQNSVSMETLSQQIEEGKLNQLNLIIKTDVHGSLEAVKASIQKIESDEVPIQILHAATGDINENDVMLAKASSALILGFGVNVSTEAEKLAVIDQINIKTYAIIYEMLEDIEKVLKGMYRPEFEEVELGKLEVRQIFKFSKVGKIAGCYVTEGLIKKSSIVSVLRDGKEVHKGKLHSLKRFKDDIKEVGTGFECGVVIDKFDNLKEGDILIAQEIREKKI